MAPRVLHNKSGNTSRTRRRKQGIDKTSRRRIVRTRQSKQTGTDNNKNKKYPDQRLRRILTRCRNTNTALARLPDNLHNKIQPKRKHPRRRRIVESKPLPRTKHTNRQHRKKRYLKPVRIKILTLGYRIKITARLLTDKYQKTNNLHDMKRASRKQRLDKTVKRHKCAHHDRRRKQVYTKQTPL